MKWCAGTGLLLLAVVVPAWLSDDAPPLPSNDSVAPTQTADRGLPATSQPAPAAEPAGPQSGFDCDVRDHPDFAPPESSDPGEQWNSLKERWLAVGGTLRESADPQLLAAAGYLNSMGGGGDDTASIRSALRIDPQNGLAAWTWLDICDRLPNIGGCTDDAAMQAALRVDGDNAAVWARVAQRRFNSGDTEAAFEALETANAAIRFDSYWPQSTVMFERAFASASNASYPQRVFMAHGIAATMVAPYGNLVSTCLAEAGTVARREACRRFGERLEKDSGTIIDAMLGLSLQVELSKQSGKTRQAAELAARRAELEQRLEAFGDADVQTVFTFDEAVLREYMDRLSLGEFAAIDFVVAETERLKSQPGYSPCEPGNREG